jgi:undecaprenyl-diphosphatase
MPPLGRSTGRRGAVSDAIGGLTGEWPTLAAGALAAAAVGWRRGPRTALPVLAAVPGALGAHAAIKYTLHRPRPRTAALTGKHTPSFPSGHAARGAAAAGIVGYLAVREGGARASLALPLGVAVAGLGASARVYVERHWASDAAGGWGLGLAAAALCALWYERERDLCAP